MGDIQTFDAFMDIAEDDITDMMGPNDMGFVVDSREKAEWAMRKISRAEASIQENAAAAQAEIEKAQAYIDRIRTRLHEINRVDEQTVAYLGQLIRPWAETEIAKNGKRKSLPLLGGTVGFRASPDSLEVTDPDAAIAWLKEHTAGTSCLRVKEEIDKREVKKLIEFSGEIPDGVQMKKGEIRFYVEAAIPEIEGNGKKEVTNA